jgi:hypothetical protein
MEFKIQLIQMHKWCCWNEEKRRENILVGTWKTWA